MTYHKRQLDPEAVRAFLDAQFVNIQKELLLYHIDKKRIFFEPEILDTLKTIDKFWCLVGRGTVVDRKLVKGVWRAHVPWTKLDFIRVVFPMFVINLYTDVLIVGREPAIRNVIDRFILK